MAVNSSLSQLVRVLVRSRVRVRAKVRLALGRVDCKPSFVPPIYVIMQALLIKTS